MVFVFCERFQSCTAVEEGRRPKGADVLVSEFICAGHLMFGTADLALSTRFIV